MARKLSLSRAWDESKDVLRRDGSLLATVALALMVLPGVVSELVMPPASGAQLPEPGSWIAVAVVAILVGLVGQLAIIRLVIGSRMTVGEAIRYGAQRAPAYVAAMLIWIVPFSFVAGLLIGLTAQVPGVRAGVLLAAVAATLFLFVRLIVASAVATAEPVGPMGILSRSWQLTGGNWWRLFAFAVLLVIALLVVMVAVGAIASLLSTAVFGKVEPMSVGALVVALISQIAVAALSVVFLVMVSRIYLQLAAGGQAEASVPSSGT
jgi:hypothetical protein